MFSFLDCNTSLLSFYCRGLVMMYCCLWSLLLMSSGDFFNLWKAMMKRAHCGVGSFWSCSWSTMVSWKNRSLFSWMMLSYVMMWCVLIIIMVDSISMTINVRLYWFVLSKLLWFESKLCFILSLSFIQLIFNKLISSAQGLDR